MDAKVSQNGKQGVEEVVKIQNIQTNTIKSIKMAFKISRFHIR
jgi:hypothetical protein